MPNRHETATSLASLCLLALSRRSLFDKFVLVTKGGLPRSTTQGILALSEGSMRYEMIFPAREIKPYAEPVETDKLKVGEIYFGVQFLDEDCFIPILEPKVFVGRDLEAEDKGKFYFQDYDSYRHGVRYDDDSREEGSGDSRVVGRWMEWRFETGAEKHTFTYENALNVLLRCSMRRAKAGR